MKTRSVNVKTNFKSSFSNLVCRLCEKQDEEESEIHLMSCEQVINENNLKTLFEKVGYLDIFGSLGKQVTAVKAWKKLLKVWNIKLEMRKKVPQWTPGAPDLGSE